MPIGKTVRRMLGPLEPMAIKMYRNQFIDIDSLAITLASLATAGGRVLEIGCGDGALATSLDRALPSYALYLGIDPGIPEPGSTYAGPRRKVEFRKISTTELLTEDPELFDLVLICDVLHHVAESGRQQILHDAAALTKPGGIVAVKEWENNGKVSSRPAYWADRLVSGDKAVRLMPYKETVALIDRAMPNWETTCVARIPPRRANFLTTRRKPS